MKAAEIRQEQADQKKEAELRGDVTRNSPKGRGRQKPGPILKLTGSVEIKTPASQGAFDLDLSIKDFERRIQRIARRVRRLTGIEMGEALELAESIGGCVIPFDEEGKVILTNKAGEELHLPESELKRALGF